MCVVCAVWCVRRESGKVCVRRAKLNVPRGTAAARAPSAAVFSAREVPVTRPDMFSSMLAIVIAAAAAAASPLPRGEWHALRHVNVAASRNVSFVISVKQQNLQTLFDSALAVSTPGNPRYGKHLSPDEIHQLTSPHPDDMAAVINWLADHKISPRREHENLHVTASVAAVSSLLQTDFHLYQRSSDGHVILRTTGDEYSLPPRVNAAIAAIFGLHGTPLPIPKPHGPRHFTPPAAPPVPPDAPASFPPFPPLPPDPVAITPTILAQTYHVKDPYVDRGGKGSQAVAEFQKEYMSKDDLRTFFKEEVPTAQEGDDEVAAFKGVPYKEGTGVEALLDIEFIMGVAPGVHTEFWEWPAQDFVVIFTRTRTLCSSLEVPSSIASPTAGRATSQRLAASRPILKSWMRIGQSLLPRVSLSSSLQAIRAHNARATYVTTHTFTKASR